MYGYDRIRANLIDRVSQCLGLGASQTEAAEPLEKWDGGSIHLLQTEDPLPLTGQVAELALAPSTLMDGPMAAIYRIEARTGAPGVGAAGLGGVAPQTSIASILGICRPPSNGVARKVSTIFLAVSISTMRSPIATQLASLWERVRNAVSSLKA